LALNRIGRLNVFAIERRPRSEAIRRLVELGLKVKGKIK
jgi:hypothetical protein